jgi:hypothetical protein
MGFVDEQELNAAIDKLGKSDYARYLRAVAKEAA